MLKKILQNLSDSRVPVSKILSGILVFPFISSSTFAVEITYGDLTGSWDTTITYGQLHRVQTRSNSLVGTANGGTAYSVNNDDGNLNYTDGLVSNTIKFTTELDLSYRNVGLFARGLGFNDMYAESTDRTALTHGAKRLASDNLNLLDLYGWWQFNLGAMPGEIRVGEQVVSWGESTFIQNGINIINPVDVSRLRVPGAELREAFVPVGIVFGSLGITSNITVEAFYQYDYEMIEPEPVGSYFGSNDFVPDGGRKVTLGFGDSSDLGTGFGAATALINADLGGAVQPLQPAFDSDFLAVGRTSDGRPDEGGQFGFALRAFVPELNDTEFGLFFVNYHSRLPIISAVTGTGAGVVAGATAFGAISAGGSVTTTFLGPATSGALAGAIGVDRYASTANYFIEYPEDIQLYGASFNTEIGQTGIALQGEYSYRNDVPLQVDDVELLFAALTPLDTALLGGAVFAYDTNQIGTFGTNAVIPGFIERNVSQFQATATKLFGPILKADQGVLLGEFAITRIHNMPSKSTLRLNGPATFTSGNPGHSGGPGSLGAAAGGGHAGKAAESSDAFPDATSWGYRLAGRLDYNRVLFGNINLQPRFAWQHDVSGISPGPGGNFIEGRKALTLGVRAIYQNEWEADLSYTGFYGAGRHNLLHDRDFMAFNVKFSF